jgi:hypothetical protein
MIKPTGRPNMPAPTANTPREDVDSNGPTPNNAKMNRFRQSSINTDPTQIQNRGVVFSPITGTTCAISGLACGELQDGQTSGIVQLVNDRWRTPSLPSRPGAL